MKKFLIFLLSFMTLGSGVFAVTVEESKYYSDVSSVDKYFDSIEYITKETIVTGYKDGTYKPEKLINRAELLKILIESQYNEGDFEDYAGEACFSDVAADQWYTPYVCFGKELDIVSGYADGTFKPSQNLNLVEMLKITLEVFGYKYLEKSVWYEDIVNEAAERNFIPLNFETFTDDVDRGQMADVIARVLHYKRSELEDFLGDKYDYRVDYETLKNEINVESQMLTGQCVYEGAVYGEGDVVHLSDCTSCICEGGDLNQCTGVCPTDTQNPSEVSNLAALAGIRKVDLTWSEATDNVGVAGYLVYYGTESENSQGDSYSQHVDAGKVLKYSVSGLSEHVPYYFSVIAYDAALNESIQWAPEVSAIPLEPLLDPVPAIDPLVTEVCGEDSSLIGTLSDGTYYCDAAAKAVYGCDSVKKVRYSITTEGTKDFVICQMSDVFADDVLVYQGGLAHNGYNLYYMAETVGKKIDDPLDLFTLWGGIDSKSTAKEYAKAATGYEEIALGTTDLTDVFGDDFELTVPNGEVLYTDVDEVDGKYNVPLYQEVVYGCSPFPVIEKVYSVSTSGALALLSQKTIGNVDNGLCVD